MLLRPTIPLLATASSLLLGCSETSLREFPHAPDPVSVPVAGLVDLCIIPDDSLGPIDMQTGQISVDYSHYQDVFADHLAGQFEAQGYNYNAFRAGEVPFTLVATGKKYREDSGDTRTGSFFDVHFAPGNHYDEWSNLNHGLSVNQPFWLEPYLDGPVFMMACSFREGDWVEQPESYSDDDVSFFLSHRFYVGDDLPDQSWGTGVSHGLDSISAFVELFSGDEFYYGDVTVNEDQGCMSDNCSGFNSETGDHLIVDAVNQFSERMFLGMDWLDELTGLASVDFPEAENGNVGSLLGENFDGDFVAERQIILYCHDGRCYQNGDE